MATVDSAARNLCAAATYTPQPRIRETALCVRKSQRTHALRDTRGVQTFRPSSTGGVRHAVRTGYRINPIIHQRPAVARCDAGSWQKSPTTKPRRAELPVA
eukprot:scaffold5666_cov92-Phaeocystis_antarctica.AAC.4